MTVQSLIFALCTAVLTLTGCGFDVDGNKSSKNESYRYEFDENGCKTGARTFKKKSDYCAALLDDELNNGCARTARQKLHDSDC